MHRLKLALVALLACTGSYAEVQPLPRAQWPTTAAAAVPHIISALGPSQKSIVRGTSKENLFMLQGEWGEDIETLLGLNDGNLALTTATCGRPCPVDRATLLLMEAVWESLAK